MELVRVDRREVLLGRLLVERRKMLTEWPYDLARRCRLSAEVRFRRSRLKWSSADLYCVTGSHTVRRVLDGGPLASRLGGVQRVGPLCRGGAGEVRAPSRVVTRPPEAAATKARDGFEMPDGLDGL